MHVEERGVIFNAGAQSEQERIAFFTSLCRLSSGTVLAGFQIGPAKHAVTSTLKICRSKDQGRTWAAIPWRFATGLNGVPGSLAMAEMVEAAPGRLLLFTTWFDRSEPDRPLFDPVSEGILHSRQLLAVSADEGETWSEWRPLDTGDLKGCAGTGPALRWADGTLAYAFESFKECDDPRPGRHAAWLLVSRDGGETFAPPLRVAQDPEHRVYYWDQRLCPVGRDHHFLALFWTHDLVEKHDRNVHLLRGSLPPPGTHPTHAGPRVAAAELPRETSLSGQIAAPLVLPDGRVLAFVVDRGRPGTLRLWLSRDGGETWPEAESLVVHVHDERAALTQGSRDIDFKEYWEDMGKWSFGHPALRLLEDGRVLLAYYAGSPDCMSIQWARVALDEAALPSEAGKDAA